MRDKAFNIAKNAKYYGYWGRFGSMVYKVFVKKASGRGIKSEIIYNKELAEVLHKPIVKTFKKSKSIINFYRKYCGCRSGWYALNN